MFVFVVVAAVASCFSKQSLSRPCQAGDTAAHGRDAVGLQTWAREATTVDTMTMVLVIGSRIRHPLRLRHVVVVVVVVPPHWLRDRFRSRQSFDCSHYQHLYPTYFDPCDQSTL